MATGTVKWFNNQKGYGFICPTDSNEEVFAHFSSIIMEGYKSLKAGQPVEFEINKGPKGLHAMNIRPQGQPSASRSTFSWQHKESNVNYNDFEQQVLTNEQTSRQTKTSDAEQTS